jgi:hypothetical protein
LNQRASPRSAPLVAILRPFFLYASNAPLMKWSRIVSTSAARHPTRSSRFTGKL